MWPVQVLVLPLSWLCLRRVVRILWKVLTILLGGLVWFRPMCMMPTLVSQSLSAVRTVILRLPVTMLWLWPRTGVSLDCVMTLCTVSLVMVWTAFLGLVRPNRHRLGSEMP